MKYLPCPFCKSIDVDLKYRKSSMIHKEEICIACNDCNASGPSQLIDIREDEDILEAAEETAAELWNTRN